MRPEHQYRSFQYGIVTQWKVNSHLVTMKVRVKCGTGERVQTDRFVFNQYRLISLDTESVMFRSTVQQNRVSVNHIIHYLIVNLVSSVNYLLCDFNSNDIITLLLSSYDKRLNEFNRHLLRKSALMHF